MEIVPFCDEFLAEGAALFIEQLKRLRQQVPHLPDRMTNPDQVTENLAHLISHSAGVAALDRGKLVGYLGWYLVDNFRDTDRRAAYCPEWAHSADDSAKAAIYRALYRAASEQWRGYQTHAITVLAHDQEGVKTWFWNGFGLTVVDAVRPMTPLERPVHPDFAVRKASRDDIEMLMAIEREHWQHYTQPPILMVGSGADDAAAFAAFLEQPANSVWLALCNGATASYMRFEESSFGAASIVESEHTIAITGAFTRPEHRGKGAAVALLDAALRGYAARGFTICSVDFESFNPEAAAFWMKYFEPVCFSMLRVPEISEW